MGINTVPHRPYSRDLAPCNFWLFPKLRGCRYETIEEMKEAVTKVIDMLAQEDFHGAFQKILERYNKGIAARSDCLEGDQSFMCVLSTKVPIRKKSGNLFNDPRTSNYPPSQYYGRLSSLTLILQLVWEKEHSESKHFKFSFNNWPCVTPVNMEFWFPEKKNGLADQPVV